MSSPVPPATASTTAPTPLRDDSLGPAILIVLAVAVWVVRGSDRFWRADFWGEDGVIFFTQVHTFGLRSLVKPYAGYIHVIPRVLALALEPLPLSVTPRAYDLTAVVVALAMVSPVLSRRLQWLLPSMTVRAVTFFALCVLPGDWESYGNIANLIFFGGICLAILALSDDPSTGGGRSIELVLLVLLGFSGPDVALILPLFAYRVWRTRSGHSLRILSVAVVTAVIQYDIFLHSQRVTADSGNVGTLVRELLERVVGALLVGDSATAHAWRSDHLAVFAAAWLIVLTVAAVVALRWVAGVLAAMVLVTLAPAAYVYGSIGFRYVNLERQYMLPRVLLVVMAMAAVAKGLAWSRTPQARLVVTSTVCSACLALASVGVAHDFWIPSHGVADTARFEACLRSRGALCEMDIAPRGWMIRLSPKAWR